MFRMRSLWALLSLGIAACAVQTTDPATSTSELVTRGTASSRHEMPTIQAAAELQLHPVSTPAPARTLHPDSPTSNANGITYNGGPVMTGTPNVYFIYYGDWGTISTNTTWSILSDWANNIGGSAHFGINSTYYDGTGNHVLNSVRFGGIWYQKTKSHGSSLNESTIRQIVGDTIDNNQLPLDTNGVYYVLTAADVSEGDFCGKYCGYHNNATIAGANLKYSFIGNPSRCPSSCIASQNQSVSPNGNVSADGMVSVMTHELEETLSDPNIDGWHNSGNTENGDLCAWNFGTTRRLRNGSSANVTVGGRSFLIQQNWLNANGGSCQQTYPHEVLQFRDRDTRLATFTGDWEYGSYKSECGRNGAVTGLSEDWGTKAAHSSFCTDSPGKYPHNACTTVDFTSGDNRRTTSTGDWDYGYDKGECGANEYVAGVSQRPDGYVTSILCCPGSVSHASCAPRYQWAGDSRESSATGDWDYGYVKLECGADRYVAGVARNNRAGQPGGPDAILCCQ